MTVSWSGNRRKRRSFFDIVRRELDKIRNPRQNGLVLVH